MDLYGCSWDLDMRYQSYPKYRVDINKGFNGIWVYDQQSDIWLNSLTIGCAKKKAISLGAKAHSMSINLHQTPVFWSLYLFLCEDNKRQTTHKGTKLPTLFLPSTWWLATRPTPNSQQPVRDDTERPGPSFEEPWP